MNIICSIPMQAQVKWGSGVYRVVGKEFDIYDRFTGVVFVRRDFKIRGVHHTALRVVPDQDVF